MILNKVKISINILYLTSFVLISVALAWHYRGNPGDIGIISDAGQKILNGVNPYVESEFANSPVTAVTTHLIGSVIPTALFLVVIQVLNIIGIFVFAKYVHSYFDLSDKSALILFLVTLTISYRALIANVQLTGILLALFAISQKSIEKPGKLPKLAGYFAILFAFELKPQIVLPLLLIIFLNKRDYFLKFLTTLVTAGCHIVLNFYYGSILEILWIEKILAFSNKSFLEGPEISLWKAVAYFSQTLSFTKLLSTIFLLVFYLFLVVLIFRKPKSALIVGLAAPFIGSYAHMYDLLGLFIVFLALNKRNNSLSIPIILLLVVPYESSILTLIVCSCLVLILIQFTNGKIRFVYEIEYLVWAIISVGLLLATKFLSNNDQELSLSLRLIFVMLIYGLSEIRSLQSSKREVRLTE
jgi:hypothetical protein